MPRRSIGTKARLKLALSRAVWIVLLLAGQHSALTHAVWHARSDAATHRAQGADQRGPDRGSPSPQSKLCGFDAVFSQVVGGVHASITPPVICGLEPEVPSRHASGHAAIPGQSFLARGPPPLL